MLYLHTPWAPPSSAVLGTFNQKAPDYPCPFPKTPMRAEAELMLSQWSETSSFSEPQFQHCKVETLIPTSMSSYYVPDAGKIITRGKMKSWMIVLFCSQTVQDRSRETRAASNEWNRAFNPSLLPENQWTIVMVDWSATQW